MSEEPYHLFFLNFVSYLFELYLFYKTSPNLLQLCFTMKPPKGFLD